MKINREKILNILKSNNVDEQLQLLQYIINEDLFMKDALYYIYENNIELLPKIIYTLGEIGDISTVILLIRFYMKYELISIDNNIETTDNNNNNSLLLYPSIRYAVTEIALRQPEIFVKCANEANDMYIKDYMYEIVELIQSDDFIHIPLELCKIIGINEYYNIKREIICNKIAHCLNYNDKKNEDFSIYIRTTSAKTLYKFGDKRGIEHIINTIIGMTSTAEKLSVLEITGELLEQNNSEMFINIVIRALHDKNDQVKEKAIFIIESVASIDFVDELSIIINDYQINVDIRLLAQDVLNQISE